MSKKSKKSVVISVRLDETTLNAVDLLVNSGLAQSRSEAASQFITVGVQSSEELLIKAKSLEENVRNLKNEMLDAVKDKNLEKVKSLLSVDDTLKDAISKDGHTAVLLAAYYRANEIKEVLLQKGAELNLYEAAAVGNTTRIQQLIDEAPQLINSHNFDGFTPLGLAAHFGHEEAVKLLLDSGADINLKGTDQKLHNTPLHAAIAGNYLNVVRLLLNYDADIDAQCEGDLRKGYTPLHVAVYFNRLEMVKLLLENGANSRIRNSDSLTPSEYAFSIGYKDLGEIIQEAWKK